MTAEYDPRRAIAAEIHNWSEGPMQDVLEAVELPIPPLQSDVGTAPATLVGASPNSLAIGLINFYRFAQECLVGALGGLQRQTSISRSLSVEDFIASPPGYLDINIYYLHGSDVSDAMITQTIGSLCRAALSVPLMVFSDVDQAAQSRVVRATIKGGARGFVLMRSADLPTTLAALRFVAAGGTFVPSDLLLPRATRTPTERSHLTSRQVDVLSLLRQGKPNKIIAYELGMSESTVKVHLRNIMGKLGATNRTEAVFRASADAA